MAVAKHGIAGEGARGPLPEKCFGLLCNESDFPKF